MTDIERDYKGDSNRLQAVIKQWPHSDNPSLKYKELLKACRSERVSSAVGGTYTHDLRVPMVAHMPLLLTYQRSDNSKKKLCESVKSGLSRDLHLCILDIIIL